MSDRPHPQWRARHLSHNAVPPRARAQRIEVVCPPRRGANAGTIRIWESDTYIDVRARADRLHLHFRCRVALVTPQSHPRLHLRRRIDFFCMCEQCGRACGAPIGSGVGLHARPLRQRVGLRCLPQLAASWWWMRPHAAFATGPISTTLRYSLYDASCPSSRTVSSLLRARLFPAALHPPAPALCILGGERPSTRRRPPPPRPSAPRPTSHSAVRCTSAPTGVMYPRAPMTDCTRMG
ncbi:hypothetical protein B0H13DRAFT_606440 [Mycena leptocephala]|nr:hypothetical protein B0H13DRAFT_606440 [Mycena leptocephala]